MTPDEQTAYEAMRQERDANECQAAEYRSQLAVSQIQFSEIRERAKALEQRIAFLAAGWEKEREQRLRAEAADATVARCKELSATWRDRGEQDIRDSERPACGDLRAARLYGQSLARGWCASDLEAALSASSTPDTTQMTTKI